MVEAARTTTSTFGIWAIIVVAVVALAVWLVGVSVADSIQTRESRRWRQRVHGSEPAMGSPGRPAAGNTGSPTVPGQRTGDSDRAERSLAGPDPAGTEDDSGRR